MRSTIQAEAYAIGMWIYYNQNNLSSEQVLLDLFTPGQASLIGSILPSGSDLSIFVLEDVTAPSGLSLADFYNTWHYIAFY